MLSETYEYIMSKLALQCSAPGQQNSLAVANEEGFVTIFNTREKKSSVLKGWYLDSKLATYVKHSIYSYS